MRSCGRVEVSPGFLLLMAWMLYLDTSGVVPMGILACGLHELGHIIVLRRFGNDVRLFTLTVFGAEIVPKKGMGYREEFLVAGAGPCVNLFLAGMFARVPRGETFAGINLALATLNLLPVRDLDGARILRCGLAAAVGDRVSAAVSWCLDFCFTLLFSCAGLWLFLCCGNLTLLLMSFWMLLGSGDEKRSNFLKKNRKRGCQIRPKKLK